MKNETKSIPIRLPKGAKNIHVEVFETEGKVEITFTQTATISQKQQEIIDKYFPVAKLSSLSLEDSFLQHEPKTMKQKEFKMELSSAINSGLFDIRVQRIGASVDELDNIYYCEGHMLATNKSSIWWEEHSRNFMPEKDSRSGERKEWIAFCGLLLKELVEEEHYAIDDAWKVLCDQSKLLGHYRDSEQSRHKYEPTGSRTVRGWSDLASARKVLNGSILASGSFLNCGDEKTLTSFSSIGGPFVYAKDITGWIVMSV